MKTFFVYLKKLSNYSYSYMGGGNGGPPPIIWLGGPGPLNNNLAKNINFFKVEISDFMYSIDK